MSLIVDALQKSEGPTPIFPRHSRKPRWIYAALMLGCAILALNLIQSPQRPLAPKKHATASSSTHPATAFTLKSSGIRIPSVQIPAIRKPVGLNLLLSAQSQWRLSGTIQGNGKPLALINGQVIEEGSTIDGTKVVRVGQDEADLETDGQIKTIRLR